MRYRLFGKSGLRVSELCLGAMTFGTEWGWGSDEDESRAVFDAFAEAGGNFIDTAYFYTNGTSERMLGDFVRANRSHFVVATKYATMDEPEVTATGMSRKAMRHAVEVSLKRLGTDYIDVYWVHAWDLQTPVEELMRGLDDLVREGKVLYIGVSNVPAWQVARCNTLAELRGWSSFAGLQMEYNLLERTGERELLPMAAELDIAITAWSPLAGGILSGKYDSGFDVASGRMGDLALTDQQKAVATLVAGIGRELGVPTSAVALAALRQLNPHNTMIPLFGARTVDQLKTNLASIDVTLDAAQLARLDAATAVPLGTPHEMLDNAFMRRVLTGDTYDRLQRRRHLR